MRLVFTNADQDTFDEYRSRFVTRVVAHARRQEGEARVDVSPSVLQAVLDFKYGEPDAGGDGLLARWQQHDVVALLLDWLPRLGGTRLPALSAVRAALTAWIGFLDAQGRLDPRSDTLDELLQTVDEVAEGYERASRDRAEHHIAAYMTEVMDENGIDFRDPAQVTAFEQKVDDGIISVDVELLTGLADGTVEPPPSFLSGAGRYGFVWRAPRILTDEAIDAAITEMPAFAELKDEISTLDAVYDETVGADSPEADERDDDPESVWDYGYESIAEDLFDSLDLDEDEFEDAFGASPEDIVEFVLMTLFMERLPHPLGLIGELVAMLSGVLDDDEELSGEDAARFDGAADFIVDRLERLGALTRDTDGEDAEDAGGPVVSLTPLGEWAAYQELTDAGYAIRTFDELLLENAEVLIERAATAEPETDADLEAWIDARDPVEAVRELVEVARVTDDCTHRAAVSAATVERALEARPVYEELRGDPAFGGQARAWLFHAGFLKESDLEADDLEWNALDGMAAMARMDLMSDEQIADLPVRAHSGVPSIIDLAVEHRHPETEFLLSWLGENHPDAKARKDARTALFRYSSRNA